MPHRRLGTTATAVAVAASLLCTTASALAQVVPLSHVEIRLQRYGPGGGCFGPCQRPPGSEYRIIIRGDGTVEYREKPEPEPMQVRVISTDDVIALVNEFVAAGFLDAREHYVGKIELVRKDDGVMLQGSGSSEAPGVRLRLKIGDTVKEVNLVADYPQALGRLIELVDRIGGPQTWPSR